MTFLTNFSRTFQMVLEMLVCYMHGHVNNLVASNMIYVDVI